MARRPAIPAAAAVTVAAGLAALVSVWAVHAVEARTARAVKSQLLTAGITWADVQADGLRVVLSGLAPNEAQRLRALNLAGGVIDANRVRDELDVVALRAPEAPRFLLEMLRNDDDLSLIGLLPAAGSDEPRDLAAEATAIAGGSPVADMLEVANWPAPEGWTDAVDFAMAALAMLPRSKISVAADRVTVTAIAGSEAEKRKWEADLARRVPGGVVAEIVISAPRPVLTPFTLRFVKDAAGARFDACSADTDRARDRILSAGAQAGVTGKQACTVGLGVPTPRWGEAAVAAINAVGALGQGTVTFSDADITLTAAQGTSQAAFDRVVGELQTALPPVFSLTATPPVPEKATQEGPAEFTATLAAGRVELRGRLTDDLVRGAVDSFARARFGHDAVYTAARLDADLPEGWPVRVLAGLESLAQLDEGALSVRADLVAVRGVTGRQDARARIAQLLSDRLGPGQTFTVDVRYDEALDPDAALPEPQVCIDRLNAVLAAQKITFPPGSSEIAGPATATVDALAAVLRGCPPLAMEIAGHTDSQGSEGGNAALSEARARAVLAALQGRRLPLDGVFARGYGEARPIADNATEAGREANRRIEFTLLAPPAEPVAAPAEPGAEPAASDGPLVLAQGAADPVNGLTRSITLSTAETAPGAEPAPAFEPSDETYPRPPRRPGADTSP
ncbi:MAG: OmpA family protein [Paracoccaceae bacterium]|nr:MAG: OmpA family protein [Paracoccaceae bacterium]